MTSSRRRHANADYQGSHSASRVKDELIIKALKAIANRQELPSKPPMDKMPTFWRLLSNLSTLPQGRGSFPRGFLRPRIGANAHFRSEAEMLYLSDA